MHFKHPELLWALFLLVIPIIVHLFQLRKFQKVWFTNVAFLREIKLQTRKSSTLKKWLTLVTRMLALAFLILAFAEPFFLKPTNNTISAQRETVIYLDNSFSMQAKGKNGPLLQRAVRDIMANLHSTKKFTLFTNNETYLNTSLSEIQNELVSLPYSYQQLTYNEALLKGASFFSDRSDIAKDLIFISDFQVKSETPQLNNLPQINIRFVQVQPESLQNIAIDSAYISKNQAGSVQLVSVLSSEKDVANETVSLFGNGKVIAKSATNIKEGKKSEIVFSLEENTNLSGYLSISDDGLEYDNSLYFNLQKPEKINVLSINGSDYTDNYLKKIYSDTDYNYTEEAIANINYNDINSQDLIILNLVDELSSGLINSLQAFIKNGGFITVIPSANCDTDSFNQLLSGSGISMDYKNTLEKNITAINFSHPLFKNTFEKNVDNFQYPKVNLYYKLSSGSNALTLEDNNPFLATSDHFYVFAAPLQAEYANFQNYVDLVIPVFVNMARNSLKLPTLYYTIGKENKIDIKTQLPEDNVLEIRGSNTQFIPLQESLPNKISLTTKELPETSGNYTINHKEDIIYPVSFNYNRNESNLKYFRLGDFSNNISTDLSEVLDNINSGNDDSGLWKWFVIFALLFLGIEMFILKFLK